MDSYFPDQPDKRTREEKLNDAKAWLEQNGYERDPIDGKYTMPFSSSGEWNEYSQDQQSYDAMPNQWNGYTNENQFMACNPLPSSCPNAYGGPEMLSFEDTVMKKLDALQIQLDAISQKNDEENRKSLEAKILERFDRLHAKMEELEVEQDKIGVTICRLVQGELTETEESIVKRFEQRLQVCEEQCVKRSEQYSKRTTHAFEKLESWVEKMLKQCEGPRIEAVVCPVQRLENRMEN